MLERKRERKREKKKEREKKKREEREKEMRHFLLIKDQHLLTQWLLILLLLCSSKKKSAITICQGQTFPSIDKFTFCVNLYFTKLE